MLNEELIREIARKACCEALQAKSQEIAEDVTRRIGVALATQLPQHDRTRQLRDGTSLIAGSRTQTEILEALLAAGSALTPRCGLLILHGAQASGWNCHGLTALDNFKRITMDCTRGTVATVVNSCRATAMQASELDPVFIAKLGLDRSAQILLVPVLLKQRVAALLLALSSESKDLEGLELLVQVAQLTLDVQAYRKASGQPVAVRPNTQVAPTPSRPDATNTAIAAVHAPKQRTEHEADYVAPPTAIAAVATPNATEDASVPAFSESPQSIVPVLDEVHEKARRFAKLLVEEIKLYNQSKVAEGRAHGDLYSRLREDIEKSRAAYQKRYGESVRDVDYFTQELMRILADNSRIAMGAGFPE
jgi:hypothetical protein